MSADSRKRVLVVDDSPILLELATTALGRAGFDATGAATLEQLTDYLAAPPAPDAILLDVCMPEAFGDDVGRVLRRVRGVKAPILLYSDIDEADLARRTREAEVDGYISKRAGIGAMVERVRSLFSVSTADVTRELQALFLPRFLASAQKRLKECDGASQTQKLVLHLHSVAGEAAAVGLAELANQARAGEALAREWESTGNEEVATRCREALSQLANEVQRLAQPATTQASAAAPPAAQGERGRRILVMDDSQIQLDCTRIALAQAGYEVRTAGSLAEFDVVVKSWRPDLVLTDVHMPEITGSHLCGILKRHLPTADIPVVLHSSLSNAALAALAAQCGADAYLSKDHGYDRLVEELEKLHVSILW